MNMKVVDDGAVNTVAFIQKKPALKERSKVQAYPTNKHTMRNRYKDNVFYNIKMLIFVKCLKSITKRFRKGCEEMII